MLAFELWEHGAIGIEELPGILRATFIDVVAAERSRDALAVESAVDAVDDASGLDSARDLLRVELAGRFAVHPPWLDPPSSHLGIAIDPGHAFGSGSHPSTRGALALVADEVPPARRVLDVGCGSGVLSIGAALLGARVTAVDIDPAAIDTTTANAERNGVSHLIRATTGSADLVEPATDLAILNVTVDIHERLARTLDPTPPRLVVAGLLGESQLDRCAAAYRAVVERANDDHGWMAAVLTRS